MRVGESDGVRTFERRIKPLPSRFACGGRTGRRLNRVLREKRPRSKKMDVVGSTIFFLLAFILVVVVLGSFFTVNTAEVAVITRFGKFRRVAEPGLNWKWPIIDRVAGKISLRVNQINLTMETKTRDNVFVTIPISVQNRVRPEKIYDAFYKLSNPMEQIQSYVEQVILGHVPRHDAR
jgi:hypothetical protein